MQQLIRKIAFPFVPIYYSITFLRNVLYDLGLKTSKSYNFPIICVGNLSVGGTGKTPMIEYLISLLKNEYNVATLSRGYKRKTEGFQLANEFSTVETIGDEPFQFYNKYGDAILVAVDANRNNGIKELRLLENTPEVILLDDAFQHRKVKAGFNILLTTYNTPYVTDIVLPTGDLREPRKGAKRADIIVITKCPENISDLEKSELLRKIAAKEHQHVFFSSISYSNTVFSVNDTNSLDTFNNFTLVTGIANATPLVNFLNTKGLEFNHLNYKDHHDFTDQDLVELNNKELLLTTEKDFMRLKQYESLKDKLFYLPIKVVIDNEDLFNKLIKSFLKV